MMKDRLMSRIILAALSCILVSVPAVISAQEQPAPEAQLREKGWATLRGTVTRVEPDRSPATPGKQLVLSGPNKETTILIGKQVNNLVDKEGASIVVTGVYKPAMRLQGTLTAVMEVRFIDRVDEKKEKDENKS